MGEETEGRDIDEISIEAFNRFCELTDRRFPGEEEQMEACYKKVEQDVKRCFDILRDEPSGSIEAMEAGEYLIHVFRRYPDFNSDD